MRRPVQLCRHEPENISFFDQKQIFFYLKNVSIIGESHNMIRIFRQNVTKNSSSIFISFHHDKWYRKVGLKVEFFWESVDVKAMSIESFMQVSSESSFLN